MEKEFEILMGRTLTKIEGMKDDSEVVNFTCDNGQVYSLLHDQD